MYYSMTAGTLSQLLVVLQRGLSLDVTFVGRVPSHGLSHFKQNLKVFQGPGKAFFGKKLEIQSFRNFIGRETFKKKHKKLFFLYL